MLNPDEQHRLDGIQSGLDHDDPGFAERMHGQIRPTMADPSAALLNVIAVITVAAWVEVGIGWLAALFWASTAAAVVARRAWRRQQDPGPARHSSML